jgi:hypothetical protein
MGTAKDNTVARFVRQSHHKIPQFGKNFRYFSGFVAM